MSGTLRQEHISWLLQNGVSPEAIIHPTMIEVARGCRAPDGVFEPDAAGPEWLAFREGCDRVFWQPSTEELATDLGAAFCLGGGEIGNPGVTALGNWLHIHESPLQWLQNMRRGIVVIQWRWAFDHLRDVERIAISETLIETYSKFMTPRLPQLGVILHPKQGAAA